MKTPDIPANEAARLQALDALEVLDTEPEEAFDALTQATASILGVPIALVSLVDRDRQWFKARLGLGVRETPRDVSFCGHVVADGQPLVVPDTRADPRFADNPLVTGDPGLRFYMGMPLRTSDGLVLGTLCALDREPRDMGPQQRLLLEQLARQVVDRLELRRLNHLLSTANARLDLLFEGMAEGAVEVDASGRVVQHNAAAGALLGLSDAQLRGEEPAPPGWALVDEDERPLGRADHPSARALASGQPQRGVVLGVTRWDGPTTWLCLHAMPLRRAGDGTLRGVVTTIRDVTDRFLEERGLRADQTFLRAALGLMPAASLVVYDGALRIEEQFGDPGLFDGARADSLLDLVPPEARDAARDAAEGALRGGQRRLAVQGGGRRAELSCVSFPGAPAGAPRGLALIHDVTEREQLRERVVRQERLVTTGTLAAGVGHEINNPLTYVAGNIDYAVEELRQIAGGSPSARLVELIGVLGEAREGAERIRRIVRGLRAFARDEGEIMPTDVRAAVSMSLNMAMHEIRPRAAVTLNLREVPLAMADETRISQVLVNIIANAGQAFETRDPSRNRVEIETERAPDGRVAIHVSDNGPGIPAALLPRIFDPFFTTKAPGVGTGLGLSISQGIVGALGGELRCSSVEGEGTRFSVLLLPADGAQDGAVSAADPPRRRGGRVLVVDDDQSLLQAVSRFLDREHEVVALSDPRDAAARIEAGERFGLVLCDLDMPYLTGAQLLARVRAAAPEQAARFVFMSGAGKAPDLPADAEGPPPELLEKPFDVGALREIARRLAGPTPD